MDFISVLHSLAQLLLVCTLAVATKYKVITPCRWCKVCTRVNSLHA